uniref:Uncharacterized protein n=1 Tax=Anopheles atroparvus TaxID=41427 RepID=A0AAG5D224_ANOAO
MIRRGVTSWYDGTGNDARCGLFILAAFMSSVCDGRESRLTVRTPVIVYVALPASQPDILTSPVIESASSRFSPPAYFRQSGFGVPTIPSRSARSRSINVKDEPSSSSAYVLMVTRPCSVTGTYRRSTSLVAVW